MDSLPIQQTLITEEQIVTPLVNILEKTTPKPSLEKENETSSIKESLDNLFPEQQYEEKDIQKAKDILGLVANNFSPEELKVAVTEIKFLADTWLDDFERETFEGKTLNELLHDKGGV